MVREFKIDDLEQIMKIWLNENIKAHNFIPKNYWEDNYEYVKEILPNAKIYVYEINNKIVGFVGIEEQYIEGIFVDSKHQNDGVGKELINQVKKENLNLKLSVYEKNTNAIKFYKKQGFEIIEKNIDSDTNEYEYTMVWND